MIARLMKFFLPGLYAFVFFPAFGQTQSCPINSNFSEGSLTHWFAYTGNNKAGNGPGSIKQTYDSAYAAPLGTIGASMITEYNLPSVSGIQVVNVASTDLFGGFSTIPTINGYKYNNSVLLGSTSITRSSNLAAQGGYTRGISYKINVPASASTQPYTMTYAYAMVLENGMHNSNQQPLFSATLTTRDSIITCASPKYFLPTANNADSRGGGATLDSARAISDGFSPSSRPSPNPNPNNPNGGFLQDVWTKGWREVTFDLSPYRGQQVTLTFEADNCVPGGHFAYAYIALRNTCAGLVISGPALACTSTTMTYSIPALAGASYQWSVPGDWTILSGSNNNILTVIAGSRGGSIIAREINSCADLRDTIRVATTPPTVAGAVSGDNTVCAGNNTSILSLRGESGSVLKWISSSDGGVNWTGISDMTPTYTAQNLTATTIYKALVQNGKACNIDTSSGAVITVDPKSLGGNLSPVNTNICMGQDQGALLTLNGNTGAVLNWQSSQDTANWRDFNPVYANPVYNINGISVPTQYRTIVKSGVCPADTSSVAYINMLKAFFPRATAEPADTTICYGGTAQLNALVTIGTSYVWTNTNSLTGQDNGNIPYTPFSINAKASPLRTTTYILNVQNAGCPNLLKDTFHVFVHDRIIVNAGRDTSIVFNEPLRLQATSSDNSEDTYAWTPATGLDDPHISNPTAILGKGIDSVRYTVRATAFSGCYGEAQKLVRVFKTLPDIFVPNAFTPGNSSNKLFRPVPVGISSLQFFRIYNRWGQLVYSTSTIGQGWDGTLNGKAQESGSFVWMVQGTDYTGKTIFKKGTLVLVR